MSRRQVGDMELDINQIVSRYCELSDKVKEMTKTTNADKAVIKQYLADNNTNTETINGYVLNVREKVEETFDEAQLLQVIKSNWVKTHGSMECPLIRTMEYVDLDALEKAVYNGNISTEELLEIDKCRITKVTRALYYSKEKEE